MGRDTVLALLPGLPLSCRKSKTKMVQNPEGYLFCSDKRRSRLPLIGNRASEKEQSVTTGISTGGSRFFRFLDIVCIYWVSDKLIQNPPSGLVPMLRVNAIEIRC